MHRVMDKCGHKGCDMEGRYRLHPKSKRNTLGKQHLCCGHCCPQKAKRKIQGDRRAHG